MDDWWCVGLPYIFILTVLAITFMSYLVWRVDMKSKDKHTNKIQPKCEVRHVIYFMGIILGGLFILSAWILNSDTSSFYNVCVEKFYIHFGFSFGGLLLLTHSIALYVRCRNPSTPIAKPAQVIICSIGILVVTTGLVMVIVNTFSKAHTLSWILILATLTMLVVLLYRLHAFCKYGKKFETSLFTKAACPMCRTNRS
jgi:uncharacterized membrane protein